jgi:carboxypeptidase PM20D1
MQSTLEYVQKIVNDKNINVEIVYGQEPSTISKYENSLGYENIKNTIQEIWPGLPVAPYLMVAATDSRHQCRISDNVYRFSPIHLNKEEVTLMHSHNERISLENIIKSTEFYLRLIEKL